MSFEKLNTFTRKVADLPTQPFLNAEDLKAHFDAAPDEVRVYLNQLIDALKSVQNGDSGSKNIGVTTIPSITGNDVQTVLESLKAYVDVTTLGQIGNGTITESKLAFDVATQAELNAHTGNKDNPHWVTASQVGAYSKEETYPKGALYTIAQTDANFIKKYISQDGNFIMARASSAIYGRTDSNSNWLISIRDWGDARNYWIGTGRFQENDTFELTHIAGNMSIVNNTLGTISVTGGIVGPPEITVISLTY